MAFKFRHRIAFKQARSVLLISLLLGLISTCWQIYFDLELEEDSLQGRIERIIVLHRENATRVVYNLDTEQASDITKALIANPMIYRASLIDDFGDVLSKHIREPAEQTTLATIGRYFFRVKTHISTPLTVGMQKGYPAQLVIDLDATFIAENFAHRAAVSLGLGVIHDVVLACLFLLLIYRYLSQPVLKIAKWVNQLRNSNDYTRLPYTELDEIGDLVFSFDKLWQERKQVADQLHDTIQDLSKSEHFSRSLMENAGDAMFLCLPDTTIIQVNNQAVETLGVARDILEGKKLADFSQDYSPDQLQSLFGGIDAKQAQTFEDIQVGEKHRFPIEARGIKLTLQDTSYILVLARDITIRKEAERQIYDLAFFDTLTGLANRRLFLDRLTSSIELHQVNKNYGAVLYLDLDRFKTINDSLGHGIGDKLLCEVSQRLVEILPGESTCARFGGDEFVVLLPSTSDSSDACAEMVASIALKLLEHMAIPFEIYNHLLYCTASIGIAVFPDNSNGALDILRHADTALYRAKALGRNAFQFYDPEMQSSAQERLEIEKGLHQAIENNEFELWFQPQVGAGDEVIGAEALLRWCHPSKGIVFPGDFISIAEDSGQIVEIGNWVLAQGIQQLSSWIEQGLPESFRRMAINISPLQFMQVDFVDRIFDLMDTAQLPGHMLELEITENMLLNNFEIASSKMKLLKQRGISFAIDDFGTGYSSLKYLRNLPLDILKIDRSFVTNLRPSSEDAAIVQVIIATADRLDLVVVAEGVETYAQRDTLLALGCHVFQGYLYSKPVPAADLYRFLQQKIKMVEC
ncbi:putative bifunctional diguanylate cyclase/phosphodiesterase [Neptunomonas japonica]|uniref:Signal transduction protein n=1 Tax=Neptunomonas japonica JAMM 1380 TaxID=1441457 RepID=A0A7R6PIY9_9GAMM|nr:EAL domain-containing protein [Neptunomonas japonica]BBB30458.1 signal transduction protein [Neptunomonas japonica JAMM 1380]